MNTDGESGGNSRAEPRTQRKRRGCGLAFNKLSLRVFSCVSAALQRSFPLLSVFICVHFCFNSAARAVEQADLESTPSSNARSSGSSAWAATGSPTSTRSGTCGKQLPELRLHAVCPAPRKRPRPRAMCCCWLMVTCCAASLPGSISRQQVLWQSDRFGKLAFKLDVIVRFDKPLLPAPKPKAEPAKAAPSTLMALRPCMRSPAPPLLPPPPSPRPSSRPPRKWGALTDRVDCTNGDRLSGFVDSVSHTEAGAAGGQADGEAAVGPHRLGPRWPTR